MKARLNAKTLLLTLKSFLSVNLTFTNVIREKSAVEEIRTILKAVSGWMATKGTALRGDIFRGNLAQGEVALAIALSFRLMFDTPVANLAYTAVIASVAINELIAPRFLRGLLVDAGDIRQYISESRRA